MAKNNTDNNYSVDVRRRHPMRNLKTNAHSRKYKKKTHTHTIAQLLVKNENSRETHFHWRRKKNEECKVFGIVRRLQSKNVKGNISTVSFWLWRFDLFRFWLEKTNNWVWWTNNYKFELTENRILFATAFSWFL